MMQDISLCASPESSDENCLLCLRNPKVTIPKELWQSWIEPDYLYKGMGDNDCMDFIYKEDL